MPVGVNSSTFVSVLNFASLINSPLAAGQNMADVNTTLGPLGAGFSQNCFGFVVEGVIMVSRSLLLLSHSAPLDKPQGIRPKEWHYSGEYHNLRSLSN